ncbi:hypothetical protein DIPPA_30222 [Diplonema papillatum]|nr:hypothetical protein DIPPA_30222 [Diplonema papillatum]
MAFESMKKWMWGGTPVDVEAPRNDEKDEREAAAAAVGVKKTENASPGRSWFSWRSRRAPAGDTAHDPFGDAGGANKNAPLDVIFKMNGADEVIRLLAGDWITSQKLAVSIAGNLATFGDMDNEKKKFTVSGDVITLAGSNLVLDDSTTDRVSWNDGDVWSRPGVQSPGPVSSSPGAKASSGNVEKNVTWKTDEDAGTVPRTLYVTCFEQPEIEGVYNLSAEEMNGYPVWQHKRQRLYCAEGGYWMFASAMRMMDNLGIVSSATPHQGVFPDKTEAWEYFGGTPGMQEGWSACTLTSVSRSSNEPVRPKKPRSGILRKAGDGPPLTEEAVRFRLEVFFYENELVQGDSAIDDLVARIMSGNTTIDKMTMALCRKFEVNDAEWLGAECAALERFVLEQFYERYDPRYVQLADGLMKRIEDGTFLFDSVLLKLCERYRTKGAIYEDWIGQYPAALRDDYETSKTEFAQSLQTDDKEAFDKVVQDVVIKKLPAESLDIFCDEATLVLKTVTPGGVGDKFGLHKFIGAQLSHVNDKPVKNWKDLAAAAKGKSTLNFKFNVPVRKTRPSLKKNTSMNQMTAPRAALLSQKLENPLVRVQVLEEQERNAIEAAERQTVITSLFKTRQALSVGVVSSFYKNWVATRNEIKALADDGKPPTDKLKADLQQKSDLLAKATQTAEIATEKSDVPKQLLSMLEASKEAVASQTANEKKAADLEAAWLDADAAEDGSADAKRKTFLAAAESSIVHQWRLNES